MAGRHRYSVIISVVVILVIGLIGFLVWSSPRPGPVTPLSVAFIALTNNPARQWTPTRIEMCQGATGLCGMFFVRNASSNRVLWFKTVGVEQKTSAGWQTCVTSNTPWSGVEGSVWTPGYGCFYAVGWPPGLPTNATWRLRVAYGYDPSLMKMVLNQKIGKDIFHSGGQEAVVASTEVRQ